MRSGQGSGKIYLASNCVFLQQVGRNTFGAEMSHKHQAIVGALLVTCALFLLAGCGGGGSPATTTTTPPSSTITSVSVSCTLNTVPSGKRTSAAQLCKEREVSTPQLVGQ
jgi:uncharacterized lipoprotein YajG